MKNHVIRNLKCYMKNHVIRHLKCYMKNHVIRNLKCYMKNRVIQNLYYMKNRAIQNSVSYENRVIQNLQCYMKCDYMKYMIFENENLILKQNIFDTDDAPYVISMNDLYKDGSLYRGFYS